MAKGPGLYSDIGKKARDLLNRDFQTDQKFTITTYSPTGVAITSSGSKKGDLFLGDVTTQLKNKNITTEFKVDTKSNLFTTITVVEAAPGLKSIVNFRLPDQRSGKVELQYLHDLAGISTSVGLTASPVVNFFENMLGMKLSFQIPSFQTSKGQNHSFIDCWLAFSTWGKRTQPLKRMTNRGVIQES